VSGSSRDRRVAGCDHETVAGSVGRAETLRWVVAHGSVGRPLLEGIDYWDDLRDSTSQMETLFAIFANVLEFDDEGNPVNEKDAERRAAVWLYQYCTGRVPEGEPPLETWEVELY
jgi:hypothetical protein